MSTITSHSPVATISFISWPRRISNRILFLIVELRVRRAQTKSLSRLSSRELRDAGLIESDIHAANNLPIGSDAAIALHRASRGRLGNW